MITEIQSEKMVVVSDLHVGNPFSFTREKTLSLIDWVIREKYDLCLNGDGFEITQVSKVMVIQEFPDILLALKKASEKGVKIYYVVGNHDILLEHFLLDWGNVKLSPFLNVVTGNRRVRVEHGHLYDPFFIQYPRVYEACTFLGGIFLKLSPRLYNLWIAFEKWKSKSRKMATNERAITGEHPNFYRAASDLEARGFDYVIFGHTHHAGECKLPLHGTYINPGSWMLGDRVVLIEKEKVELHSFSCLAERAA